MTASNISNGPEKNFNAKEERKVVTLSLFCVVFMHERMAEYYLFVQCGIHVESDTNLQTDTIEQI